MSKPKTRRRAPVKYATPDLQALQALDKIQARCCGKIRYATRQAAEARLTPTGPQSVYRCPEKWWHVTGEKPSGKFRLPKRAPKSQGRATQPDR